ncbi:hypothetical protein M011DRAFT_66011 [Sporormia fimetaria CBS 119925]|uniref:C2H2-type domain-containing protein n=1 Tax=Sporormia fimetaria CBS 119925 TaxID=1340428 RepID=A0A6A6V987_9PLEO|nr:hypothetical protein M011DRAFT_66011 [Sporormia fimetaria CBS 119925]
MATFCAVNTMPTAPQPVPGRAAEENTPITPRPNVSFLDQPPPQGASEQSQACLVALPPSPEVQQKEGAADLAKTPTRSSFSVNQLPLPATPFPPVGPANSTGNPTAALKREKSLSHRSTHSMDSPDVDMVKDEDVKNDSDNESETSEGGRPTKKKKGQRFYCVDYPPCNLSFTRSEHLLRHIRKHTGERPFTCHCSRRFSRLDNLRQHAQTVHVNEDIPNDSLAATGTRFQRQIRTERVRPPAGRARASTLGSQGAHSRGHSRNLSASSIASTTSNLSIQGLETRIRPASFVMPNDPAARARLSLSSMEHFNPALMGGPGPVEYDHSEGNTTPTSATFSAARASPAQRFSFQSPVSTRPMSWGGPLVSVADGRRLSVPSATSHAAQAPRHHYLTPLPSSTSSTFPAEPPPGLLASPMPWHESERRHSITSRANKRRTWHPDTFQEPRPATSGLGYSQTPDAPQPEYTSQPAASQTTRLPGIESFNFDSPGSSFPRRASSPMQIDRPTPRPSSNSTVSIQNSIGSNVTPPASRHEQSTSWDSTIQRIDRLELDSPNPQRHQQHKSNYRAVTPESPWARLDYQPNALQETKTNLVSTKFLPETRVHNPPNHWLFSSKMEGVINHTPPGDSSSNESLPTPSSTSTLMDPPQRWFKGRSSDVEHLTDIPAWVDRQTARIMDRPHPLHSGPRYHNGYLPEEFRPRRFGSSAASDTTRLDALVAVATGEQQAVQVADRS